MNIKKLIKKGKITAASTIFALEECAPVNPSLTKEEIERAYLALKKHGALSKDGGAVVMIPYAEYHRLLEEVSRATNYKRGPGQPDIGSDHVVDYPHVTKETLLSMLDGLKETILMVYERDGILSIQVEWRGYSDRKGERAKV